MDLFDWEELATDSVLDTLYGYLGLQSNENRHSGSLRSTLATVLGLVGGINLSAQRLDAAEGDALALDLVDEACEHTLALVARPNKVPGYLLTAAADPAVPLTSKATAFEVIEVNTAAATELDRLPRAGPVLAQRIVDARRAGGWFTSSQELDARVDGVGPGFIRDSENVLSYRLPIEAATATAVNPDERLKAVRALCEPGADPLAATLELLITACARDPHPSVRERRIRTRRSVQLNAKAIDWVAVLRNESYNGAVAGLIDGSRNTVEVCMFHIALGGPQHPTLALLTRLVAARERGVDVRVVVDRDRAIDPYRSTVINSPAATFLNSRGVSVRWDLTERLLHSKFVVIDDDVAVIGSHNWSAGSYFEYDDLSLVLRSPPLVDSLHSRFEALWSAGTAFVDE